MRESSYTGPYAKKPYGPRRYAVIYLALPKNNIVVRLKKDQPLIEDPRELFAHFRYVNHKKRKEGFHSGSEYFAHGTCQQFVTKKGIEEMDMAKTGVKLKEVADVKVNVPLDKLKDGDIVLSRVGDCKTVGRPHFIRGLKTSGR